ncbi:MAG: endonuclease/exonuclease/phosphatase family protein [Opitutaceae bacterium]|jgi:endonuclease/exonuclease/phosphatase family metal-dependent hydrolase|nr:endonuclease/exonuclease/phosphatase family protein [Opitutaceae bacterium]
MNPQKITRTLAFAGVLLAIATLFFPAPSAAGVPAASVSQRHRKTEAAIRVVSANIRHDFAKDFETGDSWEPRKEFCRDVLLAQDADIFCFQEMRINNFDYLKENLPGFAAFYGPAEASKNAIFYSTKRFEKIEGGAFWLSDTPEKPFSHLPKSGDRVANHLLLRDKLTGRRLLVWNTHFQHDNEDVRTRQARIFTSFAEKRPADIPQILTADFNADANTPAIQHLKASGWIDSYAAVHGPAEPGYTFHGFAGRAYKNPNSPGKIDFVFSNNLLRATAAEIIRDSNGKRYPSDHYFVSAEMEYTP